MKYTRSLNDNGCLFAGLSAILLAAFLLPILSGCQSPLEPRNEAETIAVTGTLSLSINGHFLGRTIQPDISWDDFNGHNLWFVDSDDANNTFTRSWDGSNIELYVGTWNMHITAYLNDGQGIPRKAVRSIWYKDIEILSGETVSHDAMLFPIAEGQGTFAWEIGFPENAVSARMEITRVDEYGSGNEYPCLEKDFDLADYDDTLAGYYDLGAGMYRVVFSLYNGTGESVVVSAILHVYQNMESRFTEKFTPGHFPVSMLDHVLTAWDAASNRWNFDDADRGIVVARHFDFLGIKGVTGSNFGYVVEQFNLFTTNDMLPTDIEGLKALVDAALIGMTRESIGAGSYEFRADAEEVIAALVRNGTYITIAWPHPFSVTVQVGIYEVEIPFDNAVHSTFFTVTFAGNGHTGGTVPDPIVTGDGLAILLPDGEGLSRPGYSFGGWNTSADGAGDNFGVGATFKPTDNITLYTRWLVAWNAVSNSTTDTTAINFNFASPVSGLTAQDIAVTVGTGMVTTGVLTGSGTTWSLAVAVISLGAGNVYVSIDRYGIESGPRTVAVFRPPVSWAASVYGDPYTNAIYFEFEGPIVGLTAGNITVADGTGSVTTGVLTGEGTSWRLAIATVARVGEVNVSIPRTGIENRTDNLGVSAKTWAATAYGIPNTSAIDFEFSHPITGLTAGDITVADGTGLATAGALTGGGTSWRLAVAAERTGTVYVSIAGPGIARGPILVVVYPITWIATAYGTPNTTAIDFEFNVPIAWLTVGDITVTAETGLLTTGDVTGSGTSWRLAVTNTRRENVSVSINVPGIERGPIPVEVRPITWTATAYSNPNTTAIDIEFNAPIAWLADDNITVTRGAGMAIAGDVTGTGTSWRLAVTTMSRGNISVSIDVPGVESEPRVVIIVIVPLVSAGGTHTVAIRTDGTLWAWGSNGGGRLGDGTTTNRHSPVRIGTASDWASVSAGGNHTVGVRTGGTLWAWGSNGSGQLGDGTTTFGTAPIRIGSASDWASVSAGSSHNVGVRTDGTLWAWGWNGSGQLGDGTTTTRHSPVQIE